MPAHDPSNATSPNANPKAVPPPTVVDSERTRLDTGSEAAKPVEPPSAAAFAVDLPGSEMWPTPGTIAQSPREAGHAAERSYTLTPRLLPTIPNYDILSELGRGGMGVVYKARHIKLNRPTAIKMLLGGQYVDPIASLRFLIEAEVVAQIQHPHIVQVFEFGQHDGQPFFAMEFVDGGTLAGKLHHDGRFPPRDAALMVAKLADAIAAVHAKGIVHRDLKPANVLLDPHGEPKVTDFGLAKMGSSDMTGSGVIMGTPSYMSPEQAAGKTKEIGTATDVYALGVILYELLSGRAPFRGDSVMETINQVLHREPPRPRVVEPSIPRDLETICLKCMNKDLRKRYATAAELATELRAYLDGRPITARPVGSIERSWKWMKRNPGRTAAVVATVLVLVGALVTAEKVRNQQIADRIEAEQDRANDRIAAEEKRLADLRAADEAAKHRQRVTRAEALVGSLGTAQSQDVPRILSDIADVQELARTKLLELANEPIDTNAGLNARLALLDVEPQRALEIASHVPNCDRDDLLTIRRFLEPHAAGIAQPLWAVLLDTHLESGKRVRAACLLAGLTPNDPRWQSVAPAVVAGVVKATPGEFVVWARALEPVKKVIQPELAKRYPVARDRIRSGKLTEASLGPEGSAFEYTAILLSRYTSEPAELAELAVSVEGRHYTLFAEAIRKDRASISPVLKAELPKTALPAWAANGEKGPAMAALLGVAPVTDILTPDDLVDRLAKRQANAAAVLFSLGDGDAVWHLFAFPKHGDASLRSHLQHRLAIIGADPKQLMQRFGVESDVSAKRVLLLALGDYPLETIPQQQRERLTAQLLKQYRDTPDAGLHSAIDWLLRQRWGAAKEVAAIDAELATQARTRVALSVLFPSSQQESSKDWFVNSTEQTFAIVRGPVEFMLGSSPTEQWRSISETFHRKRINRTFAIATKEVTVEQFLQFRPTHVWRKRYSPDANSPAISVTWYDCVEYCNWLSEQEGIPREEWCYEPNRNGMYEDGVTIKSNHLALTGYRLPTEVEWEFACRAGSVTPRPYGRGEGLLHRYGWYNKNAEDRAWPVGQLCPNDRGLFDILGNVQEWCEDLYDTDQTRSVEDANNIPPLRVPEEADRILRGGSFGGTAVFLRSAGRNDGGRPSDHDSYSGFRPVRTLPREK